VSILPHTSLLILPTEVDVFAPVLEGQNLRYCGVGAGYDDIIINGNLDELKVCIECVRVRSIY